MAKRSQTPTANHPPTGHPPINPIDPKVTVKPNPCAPPPVKEKEKDCKCPAPPTITPEEPRYPRNPRRPADDCCEQLISILQQIPGLKLPPIHKPKQKPAKKAMRLCETFGIADAIVPLVDALWKRFEAGQPGRNDYEKEVMKGFGTLNKRERTAMHGVMEKYQQARAGGQVECLFNDCLANAAEKGPIAREWVFDQVMQEGLAFASNRFFSGSNGANTPGQVRNWDDKFQGADLSMVTYTGPWPWLTAIQPNLSTFEEYGNKASYKAVPPATTHHFGLNYQWAQTCTISMDSKGVQTANCVRESPPPEPSGGLKGFSVCREGGKDYTVGNECLRLPLAGAGSTIKLRGFNFITPSVMVRLVKDGDPSVRIDIECMVFGDAATPVKDGSGKVIADERVKDGVLVAIPHAHPTISGAPFPAGNYWVSVLVNNVTSAGQGGSVPAQLESNSLLIRIEPDKNVKYTLSSVRGRCIQETWGGGDDEIWFDAYVGHIFPRDAAPNAPFQLKTEKREFPRQPWEDMDSMEWANYNVGLFGPQPFGLGGGIAVGLIGYEVDDEDSAKEQLQEFGKAFLKGLEQVFIPGVGNEVGREILKAIGLSIMFWISIVVIVIMIAIAWLWATWAPADLIAFDIFTYDALTAWDATDPQKPLPPETRFNYKKGVLPWSGEPSIMTTIHSPLPKAAKPGDFQAMWTEEHFYETPAEDEASSYGVEFRLARS